MSIWILAFLVIAAGTLAGWRQGAIRAAFMTVGIPVAAVLAVLVGRLVKPLLGIFGVSNPMLAWALAPVVAFILISIVFALMAQPLHKKMEHFYRYTAGDLRQALWQRLNSRLGICLGVVNGAMYFVLVIFLVFHLAYVTRQVATAPKQSLLVRLANGLGNDLQSAGLSRTAAAVGTLPAKFYQLSDLAGFLMQNPQAGPRFASYPALVSLWERDDMVPLVQDSALTNAPAAGATLGEIFANPNVHAFLKNKEQTKLVTGILTTNMADLMAYLETGKSATFDSQKIIGHWVFNPLVTVAWMRQNNPKISASEMRVIRAQVIQAYAQTHILVAGDNQLFVKNLPKFRVNPGQPPTMDLINYKGDWSASGDNYDLHITGAGEEKFMSATADDLRLTVKDGKNLMIFDRAD
jgi:uncharacterized membrane protein required for colicin V production